MHIEPSEDPEKIFDQNDDAIPLKSSGTTETDASGRSSQLHRFQPSLLNFKTSKALQSSMNHDRSILLLTVNNPQQKTNIV